MMTKKQKEQFEKFKERFAKWMYGDAELALYLAQTQFLVALGFFNYIETLGAFCCGFFEKENGKTKTKRCVHKGKEASCSKCVEHKVKTSPVKRFKAFLPYLGDEYQILQGEEIYWQLRCGLSHEFLPKKRQFTIYHAGIGTFTKEQIDNSDPLINLFADNVINDLDGSRVNCGVVLSKHNGKEIWQIFVPKLAADFRRGVKQFIREIEKDSTLHQNFFETVGQINFENF